MWVNATDPSIVSVSGAFNRCRPKASQWRRGYGQVSWAMTAWVWLSEIDAPSLGSSRIW